MKICFDIDGVLADFSLFAVDYLRNTRPLPANYEHTVWSFADILTEQEWQCVFRQMLLQEDLWTNLKPIEENVESLRNYIAQHGDHDVYFLTARPDCAGGSAKSMTGLWLWDQGLPIHNLTMAPSHAAKAAILTELGVNYHLDDYGPTIRDCQGLPGLRAYVLDRPYNRGVAVPRVHSVAEYLVEAELNG